MENCLLFLLFLLYGIVGDMVLLILGPSIPRYLCGTIKTSMGKDSGENPWQLPAQLDVPFESTCYYLNVQRRPDSTNILADLQSCQITGSQT